MMTNLFSSFDPTTNIMNLSLNCLSTIMLLFLIPMSFWFIPSRFNIIWINIITTLHKKFKMFLGPFNHKGSSFIFISLLWLILFNNFLDLFPYIFTSTSHMTMTLTLALPLLLKFMLFGWINNTQHMFAHLMPQGTPPILMPFMMMIETISNVFRPGTLAVRLTANMNAGHLLLTLLGITGSMMGNMMIMMLIILQMVLLTLEYAVSNSSILRMCNFKNIKMI